MTTKEFIEAWNECEFDAFLREKGVSRAEYNEIIGEITAERRWLKFQYDYFMRHLEEKDKCAVRLNEHYALDRVRFNELIWCDEKVAVLKEFWYYDELALLEKIYDKELKEIKNLLSTLTNLTQDMQGQEQLNAVAKGIYARLSA